MNFTIKKITYKGFGINHKNKELYVCAKIDNKNNSGIVFYDNNSNDRLLEVKFTKDLFIGNVVCFELLFDDNEFINRDLKYVFYNGDETFLDPYSRYISLDRNYSVVKKSKNFRENDFNDLPFIPYDKSIFYLASIKGQTMLDGTVKSDNGTFKAFEKKIRYFVDMGINSVILMPVCSLMKNKDNDIRRDVSKPEKANFWGFGNAFHFSLDDSLASSEDSVYEFKHMVSKYHEAGIEIIPILQFSEETSNDYITDVLKYWLFEFHIDGFRLIGNHNFEFVLLNPLFTNTKVICDNIDFENYRPMNYMVKNLASSRNVFMNKARAFVKGDEDLIPYMSYAVRENPRYYSPLRFVTDFNGFTLYDLVSYNLKHNEKNGEENLDGTDYNYSWNCGAEGDTKKRTVLTLRKKQARNLMILNLLCQGSPVIRGGDEVLNTQFGNNNPYCQDNEIGWVKYRNDKTARDFYKFTKNLISFRKRHSILHQPKELMMFDYMSCKVPDVSFHGTEAFKMDQTPVSRSFGVLYYGDYSKQYTGVLENSVYIVYNMYWEKCEFSLPVSFGKKNWRLLYSTDGTTNEDFCEENAVTIDTKSFCAAPRSISILIL